MHYQQSYMFDTNVFNHILDRSIDISILKGKGRYYVTHIQLDEINAIKKDIQKKNNLLEFFSCLTDFKVPTESAVWDVSK